MFIHQSPVTEVQRIPVSAIAPDLRPKHRQPRLLPLPNELMGPEGATRPLYQTLIADLRALGQSLQERQLQPIVVYPGTSQEFPEARYLILVGHRRWTAAVLVGLSAIDAIVVELPGDDERVRLQYVENEDREEFSDIERMWAIDQLREAMGCPTWKQVEERLKLSTARREQLRRLRVFSPEQQKIIALLGAQETQLRPLHTALRDRKLTSEQGDALLARLVEISEERARKSKAADGGIDITSRRTRIDGPTIARLVAQALEGASGKHEPTPRWLTSFEKNLRGVRQSIQQVHGQVPEMPAPTAERVLADLEHLAEHIGQLREILRRQHENRLAEE